MLSSWVHFSWRKMVANILPNTQDSERGTITRSLLSRYIRSIVICWVVVVVLRSVSVTSTNHWQFLAYVTNCRNDATLSDLRPVSGPPHWDHLMRNHQPPVSGVAASETYLCLPPLSWGVTSVALGQGPPPLALACNWPQQQVTTRRSQAQLTSDGGAGFRCLPRVLGWVSSLVSYMTINTQSTAAKVVSGQHTLRHTTSHSLIHRHVYVWK